MGVRVKRIMLGFVIGVALGVAGLWLVSKLTFTIHDLTREEIAEACRLQTDGKRVPLAHSIEEYGAHRIKIPEGEVVVVCGETKIAKRVVEILRDRGYKVTKPCTVDEYLRASFPTRRELMEGRGAGDKAEGIINKLTGRQGKEMATMAAKAVGKKSCGCQSRKDRMNKSR